MRQGFFGTIVGFSVAMGSGAVVADSATDHHPDFIRKQIEGERYVVNRDIDLESICGQNDMQFVNDYDGTLGPSVAAINLQKPQVGALTRSNSPDGSKYCSGTLIGPDLFLTADHCVDRSTVGEFVSFNYERDSGSTTVREQVFAEIVEMVELGGSIDYAVLRLDGQPGLQFGFAKVNVRDVVEGEALTILQHPSGQPKLIEAGTVLSSSGNYMRYGDLDTNPGSSGSGVLNAQGEVFGVHTNGGCYSSGGSNSGVRLAAIPSSTILPELDARHLPVNDGDTLRLTGQVVSPDGTTSSAMLGVSLDTGSVVMVDTGADTDRVRLDWTFVQDSNVGAGGWRLQMRMSAEETGYLDFDQETGALTFSSEATPTSVWRLMTTDGESLMIRNGLLDNLVAAWVGFESDEQPALEQTGRAWQVLPSF